MRKIYLFAAILLSAVLTISCENEIDNYDAPNGGIKGQVLDAETGEPIPLPVSGASGVIINMNELNTGATKSVDFYAKADGSYENSKMFNGSYHMVVNGPFVDKCEGDVTINGQTTFNLTALPYARIAAEATVTGHVLTLAYTVTPTDASQAVSEVYGYWNIAPGVDNSSANYEERQVVKNTAMGAFVFDLDNSAKYTKSQYKIQANGNKLYMRVGAKVGGKVNYSKTIEVQLQ